MLRKRLQGHCDNIDLLIQWLSKNSFRRAARELLRNDHLKLFMPGSARLIYIDRHDLRRKLHRVAKAIGVVGGARDEAQEQKQAEAQPFEKAHPLGRKQVLMGDMDDPLPRMGRQVDLLMLRHLREIPLNVRVLHEAKAQLNADDAAAILVSVEDGHVIAAFVDIGDFGVDHFDEDQVARQFAGALP